jgi:hypothetical protein
MGNGGWSGISHGPQISFQIRKDRGDNKVPPPDGSPLRRKHDFSGSFVGFLLFATQKPATTEKEDHPLQGGEHETMGYIG